MAAKAKAPKKLYAVILGGEVYTFTSKSEAKDIILGEDHDPKTTPVHVYTLEVK